MKNLTQTLIRSIEDQPLRVVLVVYLCLLIPYLWVLAPNGISRDPQAWGQVGDYFGGLINPILNLLVLVVLLKTYQHQIEQKHETTFFELLRLQASKLHAIEVKDNSKHCLIKERHADACWI